MKNTGVFIRAQIIQSKNPGLFTYPPIIFNKDPEGSRADPINRFFRVNGPLFMPKNCPRQPFFQLKATSRLGGSNAAQISSLLQAEFR